LGRAARRAHRRLRRTNPRHARRRDRAHGAPGRRDRRFHAHQRVLRHMSDAQTYIDAAALGVLYAVVAFGVALVFGVMRLVNFAYGELITTAAYVLYLTKGYAAPLRLALALGAALVM